MTGSPWDPPPVPGTGRPWGSDSSWSSEPSGPQTWLRQRLFDLRVVSLTGPLDDQVGNQVGVELMTLDALGDGPVHLQIDSDGGTLGAALALMDIIDVLGVPVRATGVGRVMGPAVGVLAVCSHRSMASHARLRIQQPPVELRGSVHELELSASAHAAQWQAFCSRLSEAAGRPLLQVLADADTAGYLSAQEAVVYGLADEVATPDAPTYRFPGRPLGFAPR
jgi:ATP-dependent Clp protease, protease subunit